MPLLKKGVLLPVKGVDYSLPSDLVDDRVAYARNMRVWRNELTKIPGKKKYGTGTTTAQVMGLGKIEMSNGSRYLVRASKTEIQSYSAITDAWAAIAATPLTATDDDFMMFANVPESNFLLMTNYVDKIRKWTGAGNNSVLGGNPGFAKCITYLTPYVILGYFDDGVSVKPWGVKWCDTGTPEVWTGGNSGSQMLSSEPSPVMNLLNINEYSVAYKKESIWLGRKVETSYGIVFDCMKTGIGLSAPRAVADNAGIHYGMSQNDFFTWDGVRDSSIGGPVRDEVFEKINRNHINRCFAVNVRALNEIWFFLVVGGGSWPSEVWKYNYKNGFWYVDTCNLITCAVAWEKTQSTSWDDETGAWDTGIGKWDEGVSIKAWEEVIFGRSDGYTLALDPSLASDDGVAIDSYFVSKDFTSEYGLDTDARWLEFDIWCKGNAGSRIYLDYSIDYGETWKSVAHTPAKAYADLNEFYDIVTFYLDVVSDKIRFRVRNNVIDNTIYIRNIMAYYAKGAQKNK